MSTREVDGAKRGGRPTRLEASQIGQKIADVAAQLFAAQGFEATSIDLIVAKARISKRTFYARFASKEALFIAVVQHGSQEVLNSIDFDRDPKTALESTLSTVGLQLMRHALAPRSAFVLNRLVFGEANRSPELARAVYDHAIVRTREVIAGIFSAAVNRGERFEAPPSFLAEQFMHAVIEGPARYMVLSGALPASEAELREKVARALHLFLNGARSRPSPALPG